MQFTRQPDNMIPQRFECETPSFFVFVFLYPNENENKLWTLSIFEKDTYNTRNEDTLLFHPDRYESKEAAISFVESLLEGDPDAA